MHNCKESIIKTAKRFNVNPKTVVKWSSIILPIMNSFKLAYNFAKRLKAIKGNTPWQFILKQWKENPEYFIINQTITCRYQTRR